LYGKFRLRIGSFADSFFEGLRPPIPLTERRFYINRNFKEKPERIELRVTPQEKKKIEQLAKKCCLSLSEYIRKRALGYAPRTVLPGVFYDFNRRLGELLNTELSPVTEKAVLQLFDEIHSELLTPGKQRTGEIAKEMGGDVTWPPPDSGL